MKKPNNFELEFDELCILTIAKFAPMAQELRTIIMALKNDFERMGDHAVNIAQSSLSLIERPLSNRLNP